MLTEPNLLYIFFSFILFVLLGFSYKKFNKSIILTPTLIPLFQFTISGSTVILFWQQGLIPGNIFFLLVMQFSIYFVAIWVAPFFVRGGKDIIFRNTNIRAFDVQVANIIFYIYLMIGLLYIGLFWSLNAAGSDRMAFNKSFRSLALLSLLFSTWTISLSSVIYAKTRDKKFLRQAIITIILSAAMGSKAGALVALLTFIFFFLQFNKIKIRVILLAYIICAGLIIIPTQLMYGNALTEIAFRIARSGDVYLYSFVIGDYKQLYGYYDPLSYILHPFSSLLGVRGYDYPFGAQILDSVGLEVTGVGPQDHMTMLSLVFFQDRIVPIFIFTCFFAALIVFSIVFAYRFYRKSTSYLCFRVFIFTAFYSQAINIFVGVNAFSFYVVISFGALVIYYFLFLLKYWFPK